MKYYLIVALLSLYSDIHTFTVTTQSKTPVNTTNQLSNTSSSNIVALSTTSSGLNSNSQNSSTQSALTLNSGAVKNNSKVVKQWSVKLNDSDIPSLYTSPEFITVQKTVYQLSQLMNSLIGNFKSVQQQNNQIIWSVTAQSSSDTLKNSNQNAINSQGFDYVKTYSTFQSYMSGQSTSFVASFQSVYTIYQNLFPTFKEYMQSSGKEVSATSQAYFTKLPFQKDSYTITLLQSISSAIIKYLTARASLISVQNYIQNNGSSDLFGSSGAFQYGDIIMSALKKFMDEEYKKVTSLQGLTAEENVELQSYYNLIFSDYIKQKNTLLIQTVVKLLKSLSYKNQSNLVSINTNNQPIATNELEIFVNNAVTAAQAYNSLSEETIQNKFLEYDSIDNALIEIHSLLADLYCFNSKILLLNIEKSAQESGDLPYSINDKDQIQFQTTLLNAFYLFQKMIYQAAQHASLAKKSDLYTLYSGQSAMAESIIINWQNGQSSYAVQSYSNALSYFNAVLSASQKYQLTYCVNYIISIIQKINLEYEQTLFGLYVQNPSYISALSTYIDHALSTNVSTYEEDQALWCSIWYPDASPVASSVKNSNIYQGFYLLSTSAVQTIQSILASAQTNQLKLSEEKIIDLQYAVKTLNFLVAGLQEMLVQSSLFPDKQSADANMYVNYYTPAGYRKVHTQYQSIINAFDGIDKVYQESATDTLNSYCPLQSLLVNQKNISNFGMLARLHYARWAFCMGMYAIKYASNKDCLKDKTCIVYQNTAYQYALCALVDAQNIYAGLGQKAIVNYIEDQILSIKMYASGLLNTADLVVSSENSNMSDTSWYDALYYTQVAAAVDSSVYGNEYIKRLEDLIKKETSNIFKRTIPDIYKAYLLYQGYIWALFINDNLLKNSYASQLQKTLDASVIAVNALQNQSQSKDNSLLNIEKIKELQKIQNILEIFAVNQNYQKGIFITSGNDFITIAENKVVGSSILNKKITFFGGSTLFLSNIDYSLAQLYVSQANTILLQIQDYFNGKEYDKITDDLFLKMIGYYNNAIENYSKLGLSNNVISTSKLVSQAMAFYFYSLIIPSDSVTSAIDALMKSSSSTAVKKTGLIIKNMGSFVKDENKNFMNQSLYILRYAQQDLQNFKEIADENVANFQKQTDSSLLNNALEQQKFYVKMIEVAKGFVGSQDYKGILKELVIPLYKSTLVNSGYKHIFKTIDNEVQDYAGQIEMLIDKGISIGGTILKTKFVVDQQKNTDGSVSLILKSYNIPTSAVPQFTGDIMSALVVYTQYQNFFQQTAQPVQTSSGVFSAIPDQNSYKKAQYLINETYISAANSYNNKLLKLIDPLKNIQNKTEKRFDDYAASYSLVNDIYQEIFAYYSVLDQVQKATSIISYDVSGLYVKKFQAYSEDLQYFLIGDPSSPDYIKRVIESAMAYLLISNYTSDTTTWSQMHKKAGDLYKKTADLAYTYTISAPSYNGYPSKSAHNFPKKGDSFKVPSSLICENFVASADPSSPIIFYAYQDAQGYYQQALQNYRQSYALLRNNQSKGEMTDSSIMTCWSLYLIAGIKNAIQRIGLFSRNAFEPIGTSILCDFSSDFIKLQSEGKNNGFSSAQQGYSSLAGMGNQLTNNYVGKQYAIMKKLLIDSLIYLSGAINICNSLSKSLGISTATIVDKKLGASYFCALARYFPTLTCMTGSDLSGLLLSKYISNPAGLSISADLNIQQQYAFLYSDSFIQTHDYIINSLCGNQTTMSTKMKMPENVVAMASYISQLFGMVRTVYANAFLPELVKAVDDAGATGKPVASAVSALQQSINTDVTTAQQNMLIDSSGYVG